MQYYIYQHLGLGDHFICNGLIRSIISKNDNYMMFVKPNNIGTIKHMYSDVKNLHYIVVENDSQVISLGIPKDRTILIGHQSWKVGYNLQQNFYMQQNIPLENMWSKFCSPRDTKMDNQIYDSYDINEEYVFLHDDERYKINRERIPKNIRIVTPILGKTDNIINYSKLIENAKECHCIESCFMFMVDLMKLNTNSYAHRYARSFADPNIETPFYENVKEVLS